LDDLHGKVDLGRSIAGRLNKSTLKVPRAAPRLRNVAPSWLPGPSETCRKRLKIWIGRSGSSEPCDGR